MTELGGVQVQVVYSIRINISLRNNFKKNQKNIFFETFLKKIKITRALSYTASNIVSSY